MKTVLRTAAAGVALASLAVSAPAWAATDTATAEAQILQALTVARDTANNRDTLDFGTIAESGSGGTVTLTPAGAPTCGAGLYCTGPTNTPRFIITGAVGEPVTISLASPTITLTSGLNTMSVTLASSAANMTLDGTDAFEVGGTLTVAAGQAVGTYTGQLGVSVVYD